MAHYHVHFLRLLAVLVSWNMAAGLKNEMNDNFPMAILHQDFDLATNADSNTVVTLEGSTSVMAPEMPSSNRPRGRCCEPTKAAHRPRRLQSGGVWYNVIQAIQISPPEILYQVYHRVTACRRRCGGRCTLGTTGMTFLVVTKKTLNGAQLGFKMFDVNTHCVYHGTHGPPLDDSRPFF